MNKPTANGEATDADLVSRSLAGDRESFNQIVRRYQTLICSLAYNGLGSLGRSEDVAQETFITAWRQLERLREPAKLRSWLCGIVRNLVLKSRDRDGREPALNAETLEAASESLATHGLPSEEAISREEEAILWRSLQNIPELYRESLVLFYRQHQSIGAVAQELGLTEDAVKQRLSRGRALLQRGAGVCREHFETNNARTRILRRGAGGLAGNSGYNRGARCCRQRRSGGKVEFAGNMAGAIGGNPERDRGPLADCSAAPTEKERRLKRTAFVGLWLFVLGWCIPGQLIMRAVSRQFAWSDQTFFGVMAGFWWFYAMFVATLSTLMFRRISTIRQENETTGEAYLGTGNHLNAGRRFIVIVGVYVACFWWVVDLAWQAHDRAVGLGTAVLTVILAVWNFVQLRGATGVTAARGVAGHLALALAIILAILNWRLAIWEASLHGISLAEMHRLLPAWLIPTLTLGLVAWVTLLLEVTKRKRTFTA